MIRATARRNLTVSPDILIHVKLRADHHLNVKILELHHSTSNSIKHTTTSNTLHRIDSVAMRMDDQALSRDHHLSKDPDLDNRPEDHLLPIKDRSGLWSATMTPTHLHLDSREAPRLSDHLDRIKHPLYFLHRNRRILEDEVDFQ